MRAERLQEITEEDAKAEGFTDRFMFHALWDALNAKPKPVYRNKEIVKYVSYPCEDITEARIYRDKPWKVYGNPWVWVYSFEIEEETKC